MSVLPRRIWLSSVFWVALHSAVIAGGAAPDCLAPEAPYVPQTDTDMRVYADLIATDFERAFAETTAYLDCLDHHRLRAYRGAQQLSEAYRAFRVRATQLGLEADLAIDDPALEGRER